MLAEVSKIPQLDVVPLGSSKNIFIKTAPLQLRDPRQSPRKTFDLNYFVIAHIPKANFVSGSSRKQISIAIIPIDVVNISVVGVFVATKQLDGAIRNLIQINSQVSRKKESVDVNWIESGDGHLKRYFILHIIKMATLQLLIQTDIT